MINIIIAAAGVNSECLTEEPVMALYMAYAGPQE